MPGEFRAGSETGPAPARARIMLRPVASPLSLGFLALGGATLVLAGQQLSWFGIQHAHDVGFVLITFAFPLQMIASIVGFLARDGVAATGMGVLAATWLALGVLTVTSGPGTTSPVQGLLLLFVAGALLIPATAAAQAKLVPAAVLATAAARFGLAGIYQLTAIPTIETVAGIIGIALMALAWYAALALQLEDVHGHTVLPTGRIGDGRGAMDGSTADQRNRLEHEAGVREQL
jgi:succinate-acetate transporter protein